MLIFSILCLLFFMGNTFVLTQGCESGWFGDKCQYQCHCVSTCDTSGDCTDNKCSPGWFGVKCQYRDLVHLSTRRINKNTANNKNKTCIELEHQDNITLQWDNLYVFTWLRIDFYNEIPELITDLQILLRQDTNKSSSYVPCQDRLFYIVKPQTIDVKCDFNGTFKELVLKGRTIQSICTLNINGGRNVALKQNTTQSGIYIDATYKAEYSKSSNAVDGKALYNFSQRSCAHPDSREKKQFWTVLFSPHVVTGYVLYDRQDNFANFKGFQLTASSESNIQFQHRDVPKNGEREIYRIADFQKRLVTNVTIDRDNDLNVCEVEVYGECPPGTWGLNCSQCTAQCPHNCQVDDGSCEIKCPGFINPPFCNHTCESGWFGDGCKYQCHCEEKCDTSGYCTNNKCSGGWFGYKCQYRDLMYWSKLEANKGIFDNNDDTCINLNNDSIEIPWKEPNVFTWLRIVAKNETFLTDLKIQFKKNEKMSFSFLPCENEQIYLIDTRTLDVWCDFNETFQVLKLTGKVVPSLCTLNVNGGRNVALKQNTIQSGNYKSERYTEDDSKSSNAVDGKRNETKLAQKSCAHTAKKDKSNAFDFWSVEFPPRLVTEYVLYDRTDADNLNGFTLTAFPKTDKSFTFKNTVKNKSKIYRILDPRKNVVSNVTITRAGILNVCEVEVYGECPPGTWGLACTNCSQHCPNECHVEDGRCVNLCLGFTNPPSCDLPCNTGEYGINCTKQCSSSCKNMECNPQTGECFECSQNGTYSGTCDKPCNDTKWGLNCSEECKKNCKKKNCSRFDGSCLNGCYQGFWGNMCNSNCSSNCKTLKCDQLSGSCTGGCKSGYKPPLCNEKCDITTWGENCTQQCSTLCRNSSCNNLTGLCDKGCERGHWGGFCNESCSQNCAVQTCERRTGDCYGGCKEGYKLPNCKEACSLGNYGFNCSEKCSSQCRNSCEPTSGECINGCEDGYAGPNCNRICENGTYGAACSQNCSLFCNGSRCHHISGECYGGCTEGYMNPLCNETCPSGNYGLKCIDKCSTHCNESNKCDHVNGTCFNGCKDGFLGSTCISFCTRNTYGQNCAQNCSLHCATNNSASRCDHRTGECLVGCVQGYKQPFCLERIPTEGSPLTVILLICIVLLLALIVMVILFNKEARSKLYTQCENLSRTNSNKTYSNMKDVPVQQLPTIISVKDLGSYINTHNSDFFQDEFKRISGPANVTYEVGLSEQNNRKNRYKNIIPYDHSRVHLQTITNELEDDYINASYVRDHQNQNKYIATQGPNFVSLNDFIRMLWELRVEQVVMLTNLAEDSKVKCEQYWPKSGTKEYGTIEVRLTHTKNFTNYIVRFLELVKDKEVQKVTQYHYISWPDHGVPSSPWALVEFEQRVSAIKTSTPLVVHCSAGVGRTGTFIALQNILQQAEQTGQVDIFSSVVKLRQDRLLMVQTAGQYEFLHVAVLAAIACSKATLHISNIKYLPDNQTLKNEYLTVCSVISTLSRTKEEEDNLEEENVNESENVYENFKTDLRNRFPTIVPSDKDRPMLSCEPKDNGDYINAVFIQNFDKKSRHIVTQLPMPTTVVEFWRLVSQYNVSVLVAFETDSMVKDKTVSKFAPSSAESALKCGPFNVHSLSYTDDNLWDEQSLQVQSDLAKEKLISVTCLYVKFTDLDTRKHVSLLNKLSSYKLQKDQKIVYMCRNGATYSGFVCVLSLLMERLETESSFNVPLIVGATKTVRPEVVPTFSQYKAIYEILASYNDRQDENHLPMSVKVNNPIFDESQTDDANIYCNI